MRAINEAIIHYSATPEDKPFDVKDIRDWHVNGNGWSDIGYHFYIDLYGEIHKGRDIAKIGAHVKGMNRNSIGICYCGGVEVDGKTPKDTRYDCQKEALTAVIRTLKAMYPEAVVHGHRDFSNKACPSFDATEEYKNL